MFHVYLPCFSWSRNAIIFWSHCSETVTNICYGKKSCTQHDLYNNKARKTSLMVNVSKLAIDIILRQSKYLNGVWPLGVPSDVFVPAVVLTSFHTHSLLQTGAVCRFWNLLWGTRTLLCRPDFNGNINHTNWPL